MATLYEIDERLASIFITPEGDGVDASTGEVLDAAALDALQMEKWTKVDNICRYIKNLKSDADQYKQEIDRLKKRMDAATKKADSLETYLASHLEAGKRADVPSAQIRWRKSVGVSITDETKLPKDFLREVVEVKVDKAAIRDSLKKGETVPGACLEERQNLSIK